MELVVIQKYLKYDKIKPVLITVKLTGKLQAERYRYYYVPEKNCI